MSESQATLPSTAATTDPSFQRAKSCDSAYLLVCDFF